MSRWPLGVGLCFFLLVRHVAAQQTPVSSQTVEAHTETEPDGNDDAEDTGTGTLPPRLRLERVGAAPHALRRICDLTPFRGFLYAAHAVTALGAPGATITRFSTTTQPAFSVAFNWNREGQPRHNGGAGQGFLRVRAIDGRLLVADADPPYSGFGLVDRGTEGYVFLSNPQGNFAPPDGPRQLPPPPPTATTAGAGVLPRAYHVLDVIRFRGHMYATTGSVTTAGRAWRGPSPGGLHVANPDMTRWLFEISYPYPYQSGIWRLGFMTRFRSRLYIGLQDFNAIARHDYLWAQPPAGATSITHADLHPTQTSPDGGALTLRWYTDRGKLYWLAYERRARTVSLRMTTDGDNWTLIRLPDRAGVPTDVTRFRDALVVLTTRGLWRIDTGLPQEVAEVPQGSGQGIFDVTDNFCSAPLAVFENSLYAGGQRDGALYRFTE
jgi:hypothetical protein